MVNRKEIKKIRTPKIPKFKPDEIENLNLCVFIIKSDLEEAIAKKVNQLGGRVISSVRGKGDHASNALWGVLVNESSNYNVLFTTARAQDAKNLIEAISVEFNFQERGVGRAFALDVDGYLGAKILFK